MNMKQMSEAAIEIARWLDWDRSVIDDFHRYAQRFNASLGCNVYEFALRDALRLRGLTLEQLRDDAQKGGDS